MKQDYYEELYDCIQQCDFSALSDAKSKIKSQAKDLREHLISLYFDTTPEGVAKHCFDLATSINNIEAIRIDKKQKTFENYKNIIWNSNNKNISPDEKDFKETLIDEIIERKSHMDKGRKHINDLGGDKYSTDDKIVDDFIAKAETFVNEICNILLQNKKITKQEVIELKKSIM